MEQQEPHPTPWRRRFAEEARSGRPDLATLCLLMGAEADPSFTEADLDEAQIEIDRLSGLLPFDLHRLHSSRAWALALENLLGTRFGYHGSPSDYQRLESSLLHRVLRRRRGLPILLSVIWIEVARRAGAPVYGVALPGHFVVGFGPHGDQVLVDPFNGGRLLTSQDAELLVAGATGQALHPTMLFPADPLEIVARTLNNIRAWAAARPERTDVALWAVELSLLLPSHPARLRYEHAQLLIQRGDFLEGAAEMDMYADAVAAVEPTTAESVRHRARAARAMLN
ncbi:transglutaminase-like domain-containing protein [Streptomyces sannanensis]|uniref:Transglutaminase-like domain-containing protein n=1 Tax=Streptomyces sannanensis TaxID=285536 RepID=A0ABP6SFA6_9ACTN